MIIVGIFTLTIPVFSLNYSVYPLIMGPIRINLRRIMPLQIPFLSDPQIEAELGKRLRRRRVELGLNQTEVAAKAGLGRRTITAVENGHGCSLRTFVALLRALGTLQDLDRLLPDPGPSPIALTTNKVKERKYPYKPRRRKTEDKRWQWGDERS